MAGPLVDETQWPLVCVSHLEQPDLASANELTRSLEAVLDRGKLFVLHVDMTNATRMELPAIKHTGAFAQRNEARLDTLVRALVVVAPSAMVRGALKVLFSIKRPQHPFAVHRTNEEAMAFLQPYLDELETRSA